MRTPKTQARYDRTVAFSTVKSIIAHNLEAEAKWTNPDGLPSWWPFWSDCLKDRVRDLVRAGRSLWIIENGSQL